MIVDPTIRRVTKNPSFPSYHDVIANLSGCLINSHSVYEVPFPRLPTFVNMLGAMLPKNVRPLPKVRYCLASNLEQHLKCLP